MPAYARLVTGGMPQLVVRGIVVSLRAGERVSTWLMDASVAAVVLCAVPAVRRQARWVRHVVNGVFRLGDSVKLGRSAGIDWR